VRAAGLESGEGGLDAHKADGPVLRAQQHQGFAYTRAVSFTYRGK
jgi:hypothetical protein